MRRNRGIKMKVIGLVGGVGCGKSTAAAILEKAYGARVIIADKIGHLAMEKGCETYQQIVTLFGEEILNDEGQIDRKRLGDIVFPQPDKLAVLNGIIHPFVWRTVKEQINAAEEAGCAFVVLESAILLESSEKGLCDVIFAVTADKEVRFERLRASRGYTREKFEAIMAQQLSEKELKKQVDVLISNNGDEEALEKQLKEAVDKFILEV
ncbi:dephospho-CoA kinase [Acetivibrio ethanolgignens]|nr:dephospho-CoA kinase [Acetivibrio ethanolgignens]